MKFEIALQEKLLQNNYTFYTAGVGRLNISGSYCNAIGCSPYSKEFVDLDKGELCVCKKLVFK